MPLPTFFIKNHLPATPHNNPPHALVKPCPGSNNILNVSLVLCPLLLTVTMNWIQQHLLLGCMLPVALIK